MYAHASQVTQTVFIQASIVQNSCQTTMSDDVMTQTINLSLVIKTKIVAITQ